MNEGARLEVQRSRLGSGGFGVGDGTTVGSVRGERAGAGEADSTALEEDVADRCKHF